MTIRTMAILAAAATLMACAATEPVPEQTVEERAQERWDLLIANDQIAAWEYHSPGYREMTSAQDFAQEVRRRPVRYTDARVKSADCEEDRCTVTTAITYRVPGGPTGINQMRMTRDIDEQWLRLDGQWWFSSN